MFKFKELLGLSAAGYRGFLRAVRACVLANLLLLLSFAVIIQAVIVLLEPLLNGAPVNIAKLWLLFGAGLAAVVLYALAYRNEYRKTYTASYSESEKIRLEVAEHIRRLPLSFFNNKDLSELTTNIMADCATIEHVMSHVLPGLCADIIAAVLACGALAFYDWRMALALFAALPLSLGLIWGVRQLMHSKLGERHVQAKLNVSDQMQEYLDGIKVVKAFGLAGEKSRALETALRSMMYEAIKGEGLSGAGITLASMILQAGLGLVTLIGVLLLTGGSLGIIKLLIFIIVSARIYSPLIVVMTLLTELFYWLISTRRMQALRREPLLTGAEDIVLPDYNIEFKNVSFAYHNENVLKNINLKISQNSITALVGPSGSGKTTISRLIARFWDVPSGEILIGGQNIRGIEPECLLKYISFVFQDVVLFNDTALNNIRIGRQNASDAQVRAAAKLARCDEFIRALPQGYATIIGENGCTLSGGERQRISIARALLKDAPIVLLDEATASLDPENEAQIQAAISELVKGRTVIVIAHRLRTALGADKIAVLDNGELAEEGSGPELLAQNKLFARLYKIQQESLGWTVKR